MQIIYPPLLKEGAQIAIISPATEVKPEYIDGAVKFLHSQGYSPVVMPHAKGPSIGTYAATEQERINDWLTAIADTSIDAVLCARGGYGCVHLLEHTPLSMLRENPKWVIGFSDVSALHALMWHAGVASIHSPMAKHLATIGNDSFGGNTLLHILSSQSPLALEADAGEGSRDGEATGRLLGGNLAVLNGLSATDFDLLSAPLSHDCILFLEDIGEAIYAVERMLFRLHLQGVLHHVKGLIFGQFTNYRPDKNFSTMEDMICRRLAQWGIVDIPIAMRFPVGHVDENFSLIEGCIANLKVGAGSVKLTMKKL